MTRHRLRDRSHRELPRREFLGLAGAALAATAIPTALPRRASSATDPRIVIVGAGLAGLTAAFEIRRRTGWSPVVYEASDHVGGRTRTIRGLAGGQYAEAGGGGISSNERTIIRLVQRLGLRLRDTWAEAPDGRETYVFGGQRVSYGDLRSGLRDIDAAAWSAWKAIGRRIPSRDAHNAAAIAFDEMSVEDFLASHTDHDVSTLAGSYVAHDHAVEYGGRASVSSALELILEQGDFWGRGPYDERWAVRGGNDRITTTIATRLPPGSLRLGHRLEAITELVDGSYRLTFDDAGSAVDAEADHVVLAVPATALRSSAVDLSTAGITAPHLAALDAMAMGTNVKINVQFDGTPWAKTRQNGDATTDTLLTSTWQASFFRSRPATLVAMNNASYPSAPPHGPMPTSELAPTLAAIGALFPQSSGAHIDGQAYLDVWANDPLIGGSYACSPLGAFTRYGGLEAQREGNIHFAGEHTARYERAGTMCGAVESGIRAAKEIAAGS